MNETAGPNILGLVLGGIGFFGVLFVLLRFVFLDVRWYTLEYFAVLILCGLPPAWMLTMDPAEYSRLVRLESVGSLVIAGLVMDLPILLGAWWGLRAAQQLGEERTLRRFGLMLCGMLLIAGALAWLAALFGFMLLLSYPLWGVLVASVFVAVGTMLMTPALLVEQRLRRLKRARSNPESAPSSDTPR